MRFPTLTWPKLIGLATGWAGLWATIGWAAQLVPYFTGRVTWRMSLSSSLQFAASLCCVLFLVLSYAVYMGRDWARRILLMAMVGLSLTLTAFAVLKVIEDSARIGQQRPIASQIAKPLGFDAYMLMIMNASAGACLIAPPIFLVFVLLHPDIKRSFRSRDSRETLGNI